MDRRKVTEFVGVVVCCSGEFRGAKREGGERSARGVFRELAMRVDRGDDWLQKVRSPEENQDLNEGFGRKPSERRKYGVNFS